LARSLVLVTNWLQALRRKLISLSPGSAVSVGGARSLTRAVPGVNAIASSIARIGGASLSIIAILGGMFTLIFVCYPSTFSSVTVRIWLAITFAFFAVSLGVILSNTSSLGLITNSKLAVVIKFVIKCPLSALSISLAWNSAWWGIVLEGINAFSGGHVARIGSAANSVIAIGFGNLAGA